MILQFYTWLNVTNVFFSKPEISLLCDLKISPNAALLSLGSEKSIVLDMGK